MMVRASVTAFLLLIAAPAVASDGDRLADLLLLQSVEERMVSIGHRLATSAGDLCGERAALAGIQLHDISQYERKDVDRLATAFGPGPWPKVLAVAQRGAAARAGVHANDSIVAIDGRRVPPMTPPRSNESYARVWEALELLDQEMADGQVTLAIERKGKPLTIDVAGDRGCASRFSLKITRTLQGKADGDYVEITSGLVAFAPDDAELAAAMAHELAHNILRHRQRLDAAGVSRGILQNFGRNARITRETEIEADRLSVHLLDRAGYPTAAILSFWQRFRRASPTLLDLTHPSPGNRIAVMRSEIALIEAARVKGEMPEFVPGKV